jgi:hypothetical protein
LNVFVCAHTFESAQDLFVSSKKKRKIKLKENALM